MQPNCEYYETCRVAVSRCNSRCTKFRRRGFGTPELGKSQFIQFGKFSVTQQVWLTDHGFLQEFPCMHTVDEAAKYHAQIFRPESATQEEIRFANGVLANTYIYEDMKKEGIK